MSLCFPPFLKKEMFSLKQTFQFIFGGGWINAYVTVSYYMLISANIHNWIMQSVMFCVCSSLCWIITSTGTVVCVLGHILFTNSKKSFLKFHPSSPGFPFSCASQVCCDIKKKVPQISETYIRGLFIIHSPEQQLCFGC